MPQTQLKPETHNLLFLTADIKSDIYFPVLGQLGSPKSFLFAKWQNLLSDNCYYVFQSQKFTHTKISMSLNSLEKPK